jgi:hypothetical protein
MLTDRHPSVIWALRTDDHHTVECRATLVPTGIQVEIVSDGYPLFSRIFTTSEEALEWSEEERKAR